MMNRRPSLESEYKHYGKRLFNKCIHNCRTQQNITIPWKVLKLTPVISNDVRTPVGEQRTNTKRVNTTSLKVRRPSLFSGHSSDSKWKKGINGFLEEESKDPPIASIKPYYSHCGSCNVKNAEFTHMNEGVFEKKYSEQLWKWKLKILQKDLVKKFGTFINYGK